MSIRSTKRIDSIAQVMELTQLMGNLGEDKGHCAADGFLPIGDHPSDRHRKLVQLVLDFGQQGGQVALATAEQRTGQQDLLPEAVAHDPEHLMPYIRLQPIDSQDDAMTRPCSCNLIVMRC